MRRYTDTEKWRDKWFRALKPEFKLAWLYLVDNCDWAGVLDLDRELANFQIGFDVDWERFLDVCGDRVHCLNSGKIWLTKFVEFQQGTATLNPKNNAHKNIINLLRKHGINDFQIAQTQTNEPLARGSGGPLEAPCNVVVDSNVKVREGGTGGEQFPYRSPEFSDAWSRWLNHHTACNHGVPMPTQTDAHLMRLISFKDEAKAVAWLLHSLEHSKRGTLCDPHRFDKHPPDSEAAAANEKEKREREARKAHRKRVHAQNIAAGRISR